MTDWRHVHFIGIGGTGMSAIARVMMESGYRVTGSDRILSPLAQSLQAEGIRVDIGHRPENIAGAQVVVRSSAIPDDNVEVKAALKQGIPVLKRSEFLSILMDGHTGIAVAGTHGKTTTTGMIAWMLSSLGLDPTYIVGGVISNLGTNAHAGKGEAFVIEADEYDRMFLGLKPKFAVITNIEHDHPDCYPTPDDFFRAFDEFSSQVSQNGSLLVCGNDEAARRLGEVARQRGQTVYSYSVGDSIASSNSPDSDYFADRLSPNQGGGLSFDVTCSINGRSFALRPAISLRIPGRHNVQNALAALAVAHQMNLDVQKACVTLSEFRGVGRRFEIRGLVSGITVIDDYAHHPTEIRATLAAARLRYPDSRLWVVWQPHTFSRTRLLFKDFSEAFELADHVIVTEIYPARETKPLDGFSSRQLVSAMSRPNVRYIPELSQVTEWLVSQLISGDILIVLSAGDADQVSTRVVAYLQERSKTDDRSNQL